MLFIWLYPVCSLGRGSGHTNKFNDPKLQFKRQSVPPVTCQKKILSIQHWSYIKPSYDKAKFLFRSFKFAILRPAMTKQKNYFKSKVCLSLDPLWRRKKIMYYDEEKIYVFSNLAILRPAMTKQKKFLRHYAAL